MKYTLSAIAIVMSGTMALAGGLSEPIMESSPRPMTHPNVDTPLVCEYREIRNRDGEVLYLNRVRPWDKNCWPKRERGDDTQYEAPKRPEKPQDCKRCEQEEIDFEIEYGQES